VKRQHRVILLILFLLVGTVALADRNIQGLLFPGDGTIKLPVQAAPTTTAAHGTLYIDGSNNLFFKFHGGSAVQLDTTGAGDLLADGTVPLTANWDAGAFEIRALTFQSDQVTGTAPFIVASTTVVTNLNADTLDGISSGAFLLADGTIPLSANWDVGAFKVTGTQFESDIITGTAPFVVASTTVVTNLNADTLDGISSGAFLLADGTIPLTASWDVGAFSLTALTYTSDQVTGTAPFTVASTTVVTNLNADTLDGISSAAFLQNVSEDTTPTAGGTFDFNGNLFSNLDSGLINEGGTSTTPASTKVRMYAKADGLLYSKDDAGVETLVSGGAGATPALSAVLAVGSTSGANNIDMDAGQQLTWAGGTGLEEISAGIIGLTDGSTGTATMQAGDGTAGAPTYSFVGATTGGLFQSGGTLGLSSGGINRLSIDSSRTTFFHDARGSSSAHWFINTDAVTPFFGLSSVGVYSWSSAGNGSSARDTGLVRVGPGIVGAALGTADAIGGASYYAVTGGIARNQWGTITADGDASLALSGYFTSGVTVVANTSVAEIDAAGIRVDYDTSGAGSQVASLISDVDMLTFGAHPFVVIRFSLHTGTNVQFNVGIGDGAAGAAITAGIGCGLKFDDDVDTNFQFVIDDGATPTETDTTIVVDTAVHYLVIDVTADASLTLKLLDVAGVEEASTTVTTNLPAAATDLGLTIYVNEEAAEAEGFDFYFCDSFLRS